METSLTMLDSIPQLLSKEGSNMSRKTVERNIAYDDVRQLYYVNMDYGLDEDGRRVRVYQTYPNLALARKALREFQSERDRYRQVRPRSMTLDQWLDYWMEEVIRPNRAETTVYGYRKIIDNHLSPALGDTPIQTLSPQDIQKYYTMLLREKGLSPNTIRRHHDLLSASLRMAVKQEILSRAPTERVEPPRMIPYEAKFYGPEELRRLCALAEGTWLEVVVKLAGGLGLRREEICGLRWPNVDFAHHVVRIKEARTSAGAAIIQKATKTKSSTRTLYLTDDLYDLLMREQRRQQEASIRTGRDWDGDGMVLVDRHGEPYPPNAVSLAFSRFIKRNGLPKITLHGLRHTFATVASAQGAPLFDIGKALGHSTPSTTGRIYTHLLDQTHAHILSQVAAIMK